MYSNVSNLKNTMGLPRINYVGGGAVVKFWRRLISSIGLFSLTGVVFVSQLDDRSRMTRE